MTPLSVIKYIVEKLQGTPYEPWVNVLLFMMLLAAVLATIIFLLGKGGRNFFLNTVSIAAKKLKSRRGYSPEWERFRQRVEPYVELVVSAYFVLVGLYSALLVGLATALASQKAPLWAVIVGLIWVLISVLYMRVNLESASWAYHEIKSRRMNFHKIQ